MGTPAKADTQTDANESENAKEEVIKQAETFADKVEAALGAVTTDPDSGKKIFPEGIPEEVEYAATTELRRRETQSSYTKAQQELKRKETELGAVKKFSKPTPKIELTPEQEEELDDLKMSNPDLWRKKMNALENAAIIKAEEEYQEQVNKVVTETELNRRSIVLENFQKENPELVITDNVINNDVPPRYKQSLENGEVTFEQFLSNVKAYLLQGKVVQSDKLENGQPNLSEVGGSARPGQPAVEADDKEQYENEIY